MVRACSLALGQRRDSRQLSHNVHYPQLDNSGSGVRPAHPHPHRRIHRQLTGICISFFPKYATVCTRCSASSTSPMKPLAVAVCSRSPPSGGCSEGLIMTLGVPAIMNTRPPGSSHPTARADVMLGA